MPRIFLAFLEYVFRRRRSQRRESPLEPQDSIVTFRAPNRERAKQIIKKRAPLVHSPISVLNDDVLLHIFYIHRLHIGTDLENDWYEPGYLGCDRQRWWYKLIHVSRRWRSVILDAPSLLDLHLVCTRGVPVADMLAHSPPLPLTIVYWFDSYTGTMTAEDEEGAFLALSHRDRVHNIAICMPSWELEKLFVVMDEQFPILERQLFEPRRTGSDTSPNIWSTQLVQPHTHERCASNTMPLAHNCRPCLSPATRYPEIRVLPSEVYTRIAFTHAPARDSVDYVQVPRFQPRRSGYCNHLPRDTS
jgi:hypothetical protein